MKLINIIILFFFFITGNVLCNQNIFNVNNIELVKKTNISNEKLASKAIQKGFNELCEKILLEKDKKKLVNLTINEVKELVSYYQVVNFKKAEEKIIFNIFFDREKIHNLFHLKNISYSEILNNELYLLPILSKNNQILIYNQNFFYENWSNFQNDKEVIEFILPIENIEVIQKINEYEESLLDLKLEVIFREYEKKNIALILIEEKNSKIEKIYLRSRILGKNIDKNILVKNHEGTQKDRYEKIISLIKNETTKIIKTQNLVDERVPSFLNTKIVVNKKNNLVELNSRLKNIDLIDNIFIQEFNKEYVLIKIKYLGKLDKIVKKLKEQKIILQNIGDEWNIQIL